MKILKSIWYTNSTCNMERPTIGIVMVELGYEKKAYIGCASGRDQEADEKYIAEWGSRFPLDLAMALMG